MTIEVLYGLIFVSAIGSGVMSGLFFAFSTFVMTALARLSPAKGIAAMQSLNIAVLNPWFAAVFFGTALMSSISAAASLWSAGDIRANLYLFAGAAFYLFGPVIVTLARNVPLNHRLAKVTPSDSGEAVKFWMGYVKHWTAWNHLRTIMAVGALASYILSLRFLN